MRSFKTGDWSNYAAGATAALGLLAVFIHSLENYHWMNGQWHPGSPWAIPFAASLPVISLYLCVKVLRTGEGGVGAWLYLGLNLISLFLLALMTIVAATPIG